MTSPGGNVVVTYGHIGRFKKAADLHQHALRRQVPEHKARWPDILKRGCAPKPATEPTRGVHPAIPKTPSTKLTSGCQAVKR